MSQMEGYSYSGGYTPDTYSSEGWKEAAENRLRLALLFDEAGDKHRADVWFGLACMADRYAADPDALMK